MRKDKISVLLPDGESAFSLKTLRCLALKPNIESFILSSNKWDPIRFSRFQKGFYHHNASGFDERRLQSIIDLAHTIRPDIILPIEHHTIRLLSTYREKITAIAALPPLASPDAIDTAGDKWLLANLLKREQIPFPDTVFVQKDGPIPEDALKHLDYPVLSKPLGEDSGSGIVLLENYNNLINHLQNARFGNIIVQSFIQGHDVDCSVLCKDGEIKAYTIQKGVASGRERFSPPSVVDFIQENEILEHTKKLMRALNWSGVAHIDFRYDSTKNIHRVLEVNPRFWGSVIASVSAGVNFPYLACLLALKQDFEIPDYKQIRYVKPEVLAKLLMKKIFMGDRTVRSVKESGIFYALSDLGPETFKYVQNFLKHIT